MKIIEAIGVSHAFNGGEVLKNVSFSVESGEFLGIIGPNGAGKSTLLRILSGMLPPSSGKIQLKGRALADYEKGGIARIMAVLPSEIYIPYEYTVKDIVLMGRSPLLEWWRDYTPKDAGAVMGILESLNSAQLAHRLINSLSSGERQRVFIAQALAQEPEIMLLDEPTSHLDLKYQMEIIELLAALHRRKSITIITVSHDLNLFARCCDKLMLMKNGAVLTRGSPEEVITRENVMSAYGIDAAVSTNPATGRPEVTAISSFAYRIIPH